MNVSRWLLLLWITLTLPLNGAMAASMAFCASQPASSPLAVAHAEAPAHEHEHAVPQAALHTADGHDHASHSDSAQAKATQDCDEGCQQCDLCSMAVITSAVVDMPRLAPLTLPGRIASLPATQHVPRPLLRPPLYLA